MCVNCGEHPADYNGFCEYCQNETYRIRNKKVQESFVPSRGEGLPTHCVICDKELEHGDPKYFCGSCGRMIIPYTIYEEEYEDELYEQMETVIEILRHKCGPIERLVGYSVDNHWYVFSAVRKGDKGYRNYTVLRDVTKEAYIKDQIQGALDDIDI